MRLTFQEQIQRAFNKAAKKRTIQEIYNRVITPEMYYYQQRINCSACTSFDTFIKTWTGENWLKQLKQSGVVK